MGRVPRLLIRVRCQRGGAGGWRWLGTTTPGSALPGGGCGGGRWWTGPAGAASACRASPAPLPPSKTPLLAPWPGSASGPPVAPRVSRGRAVLQMFATALRVWVSTQAALDLGPWAPTWSGVVRSPLTPTTGSDAAALEAGGDVCPSRNRDAGLGDRTGRACCGLPGFALASPERSTDSRWPRLQRSPLPGRSTGGSARAPGWRPLGADRRGRSASLPR